MTQDAFPQSEVPPPQGPALMRSRISGDERLPCKKILPVGQEHLPARSMG